MDVSPFNPAVVRATFSDVTWMQQEVRAVPSMVRELNGVADVFTVRLARSAAVVVREGAIHRC
ncbi:hypothetical protein ACPCSQ_17560 [Streptomyces griseoincarnatus]